MTSRMWQATPGRWLAVEPCVHRQGQWVTMDADRHPGAVFESMFEPDYLGKGTIWQRDVSAMPLAANSAQMAQWMWDKTPTPWGSGAFGAKTSLNTSSFGTQPIAAYLVDSSHPRCRYQVMEASAGVGVTQDEVRAFLTGPIPWPSFALPAQNGDRALALYDIATGIMREYFMVQPVSGKPGHWRSSAGGYSVTTPGLRQLATTNYATQLQKGSSAVACMHNPLGFIGIAEVRRGHIDHALAFTTANFAAAMPPSWPAKLSDGKAPRDQQPFSPTHGQWARLSASVDPSYNPRTGLSYNPLTQLLIRAAKTYGLVATDTNAWCHAFNAESGIQEKALFGRDPWQPGGELARLLRPDDPGRAFDVSDFPWDQTEWAPVDWGRPRPDFSLRPGEYWPHV